MDKKNVSPEKEESPQLQKHSRIIENQRPAAIPFLLDLLERKGEIKGAQRRGQN